ncbi:hypothetical protein BD626DRAFT_509584 [Schizophyllum amplum]|uniref:Uncharacterized protein n=1 Tax=Schizophyllum amplum TaxID=97359 RepID=A0A550C2L3_9AGAR|nr:hypothetical protein BD626DRAFT_509584 [Auriculariopsis ampla]
MFSGHQRSARSRQRSASSTSALLPSAHSHLQPPVFLRHHHHRHPTLYMHITASSPSRSGASFPVLTGPACEETISNGYLLDRPPPAHHNHVSLHHAPMSIRCSQRP